MSEIPPLHSPRRLYIYVSNNLAIIIVLFLALTSASPLPPSQYQKSRYQHLSLLSISRILFSASLPRKLLYIAPFISVAIYLVYKMRRSARLKKRKEELGLQQKQKEEGMCLMEGLEFGYVGEKERDRIVVELAKEEEEMEREDEQGGNYEDNNDNRDGLGYATNPTRTPRPTSILGIEKRKRMKRRERLQRMKSSPSFSINSQLIDENWNGIGNGNGIQNQKQQITSSPSSTTSGFPSSNSNSISVPYLPPPSTFPRPHPYSISTSSLPSQIDQHDEEEEKYHFGQNPDYTSCNYSTHMMPSTTQSSSQRPVIKFSKLIPTQKRSLSRNGQSNININQAMLAPTALQGTHRHTHTNIDTDEEQSMMISTANFPLPTLRPEGSFNNLSSFPRFISMPSSPTTTMLMPNSHSHSHSHTHPHPHSHPLPSPPFDHHENGDEFDNQIRPRSRSGSGHARTRSLPTAVTSQSVLFPRYLRRSGGEGIDGENESGNANGNGEMVILEQGHSIDGNTGERWKWTRKVRVFRSDALRKLESDGLVRF